MVILNAIILLLGLINYNNTSGQLILYGEQSNQLVIVTNNYKMPYYDLDQINIDDGIHVYNPDKQNFKFLSDWLQLPLPTERYIVFSPGDVSIFLGLLNLININIFHGKSLF